MCAQCHEDFCVATSSSCYVKSTVPILLSCYSSGGYGSKSTHVLFSGSNWCEESVRFVMWCDSDVMWFVMLGVILGWYSDVVTDVMWWFFARDVMWCWFDVMCDVIVMCVCIGLMWCDVMWCDAAKIDVMLMWCDLWFWCDSDVMWCDVQIMVKWHPGLQGWLLDKVYYSVRKGASRATGLTVG